MTRVPAKPGKPRPNTNAAAAPAATSTSTLDSGGASGNASGSASGGGGKPLEPAHIIAEPELRVYTGDCRDLIPRIPEAAGGAFDLVFADPPFNWNRAYDKWNDSMPREDYLEFTRQWLKLCADALRPGGAFWVNIPDDTAAEIVIHLKELGLNMENWCIWHYRFGQNTRDRFINSKVHALYFVKPMLVVPASSLHQKGRTWNALDILEPSDRATTYFDPRTENKRDGMPAGKRLPMDVWYGQYWGRIQGNNKERRHFHDNQLPEVYLERVIRACTNEGDLVMDPFLGSGTTAVMAHALKRRFIGTEYSTDNAASAFERIQKGPTRPLGASLSQSSAIHPPRRMGAKTAARLAQNDQQDLMQFARQNSQNSQTMPPC